MAMDPRRLLPLLSLIVTACATDTAAYPSLASRAVEKRSWDEPRPPAVTPNPPDPALAARIGEQTGALAAISTAFDEQAARATALATAARGDAVGGERWIAAQTALADLDAQRARTLDVVGALDQLALDRASAGSGDDPGLQAASSAADAQLARETNRIVELQALLPTG
jgi:hypothetical protein